MSANRVVSTQTEELFQACESGNVQAVVALLQDPRVDINWQRTQSYGATSLIVAISKGHQGIVEILLEAKAELEVLKTPDRNSPLHEAAFKGDPKIMQLVLKKILEKSSDNASDLINLPNQFGNTPLHNAARTGNHECASQLLQAGAQPTIKNANGSIPLHHACYSEQLNLKLIQLLVEAGSDVNALDEHSQSPILVAAKKDQVEVIEYLRKNGADAALKNSFGKDALYFAKLRNNTSVIEVLE